LPADVGDDLEREKQLAAEAAAALVEDGMTIGLGTGSSASYFVHAVAARELELRCIATSPATQELAVSLGLDVEPFDGPYAPVHLDLAVDGADQVAADGWIVKGKGGAHTREKIAAAAAARFVIIVSSDKIVDRLAAPIPLELLPFGLAGTLVRLGDAKLRDAGRTPDGGILADFLGSVDDPEAIAAWLSSVPGVVDHGLFAPDLVSEVLVGRGDAVERRS
jgi:ribose 5-phosphate isomerase A